MSEPFLKIDVQGDRQLARVFRKAGDAFRPETLHVGLLAGGLLVQNDAKPRAPYLTGTLRRSIHLQPTDDMLTVKVGTDVPYAARIEYGFTGRDSLGRRYNQPAQPYLRPAIEENRERVREEVRRVVLLQLQAAVR